MHFHTLRIFHTPHFPYSSFSTLRTFHTPHFPHSALLVFHPTTHKPRGFSVSDTSLKFKKRNLWPSILSYNSWFVQISDANRIPLFPTGKACILNVPICSIFKTIKNLAAVPDAWISPVAFNNRRVRLYAFRAAKSVLTSRRTKKSHSAHKAVFSLFHCSEYFLFVIRFFLSPQNPSDMAPNTAEENENAWHFE